MTLSTTRTKVPHVYTFSGRESQISLSFTLQSLVFQIIDVLGFPIGTNAEFIFEEKH